MRRPPILFAVLFLTACVEPFTASVKDREQFDPPAAYDARCTSVQHCSGGTGDMARISWYLARAVEGDSRVARGRWSPPHDIILVKGYEDDPAVVRHEMLHDLLDGDRLHSGPEWTACGV
jgi:hypothetical protein